jgi:hypothetical protein
MARESDPERCVGKCLERGNVANVTVRALNLNIETEENH